jgi:hypothetical protein
VITLVVLQQGVIRHCTESLSQHLQAMIQWRHQLERIQGQIHSDYIQSLQVHRQRQDNLVQVQHLEQVTQQWINFTLPLEQEELHQWHHQEQDDTATEHFYAHQAQFWNHSAQAIQEQADTFHQRGIRLEDLCHLENATAHYELQQAMEQEERATLALQVANDHLTVAMVPYDKTAPPEPKDQGEDAATKKKIGVDAILKKDEDDAIQALPPKRCHWWDWSCSNKTLRQQQQQQQQEQEQVDANTQELQRLKYSTQQVLTALREVHEALAAQEQAQAWHTHAMELLDLSLAHGKASVEPLREAHVLTLQAQLEQTKALYYQQLADEEARHVAKDQAQVTYIQQTQIDVGQAQAHEYQTQTLALQQQIHDEQVQLQTLQDDVTKQEDLQSHVQESLSLENHAYQEDLKDTCWAALTLLLLATWMVVHIVAGRRHLLGGRAMGSWWSGMGPQVSSSSPEDEPQQQEQDDGGVEEENDNGTRLVQRGVSETLRVQRNVCYLICHGCILLVAVVLTVVSSDTGAGDSRHTPVRMLLLLGGWRTMCTVAVGAAGVQAWLLHLEIPHGIQSFLWWWTVVVTNPHGRGRRGAGSSTGSSTTAYSSRGGTAQPRRSVSAGQATIQVIWQLPWQDFFQRWTLLSTLILMELVAVVQVWWWVCEWESLHNSRKTNGQENGGHDTLSVVVPVWMSHLTQQVWVWSVLASVFCVAYSIYIYKTIHWAVVHHFNTTEFPDSPPFLPGEIPFFPGERPNENERVDHSADAAADIATETSALLPSDRQFSPSSPSYCGTPPPSCSSSQSTSNDWDTVDLEDDAYLPLSLTRPMSNSCSFVGILSPVLCLLWFATRNGDMPPSPMPQFLLTSWRSEWAKLCSLLEMLVAVWIVVECLPASFRLLYDWAPVVFQQYWLVHKEAKQERDEDGNSRTWWIHGKSVLNHASVIVIVGIVLLLYCYGRLLRRATRTIATRTPGDLQSARPPTKELENEDDEHESCNWCCVAHSA